MPPTREDDEGREWEITLHGSKSVPANLNGHPDTWSPAEGGLEEVVAVCVYPKDDPMFGVELDWDGVEAHFGNGTVEGLEEEANSAAADDEAEAKAERQAEAREQRYSRHNDTDW